MLLRRALIPLALSLVATQGAIVQPPRGTTLHGRVYQVERAVPTDSGARIDVANTRSQTATAIADTIRAGSATSSSPDQHGRSAAETGASRKGPEAAPAG
jgi:hypothetical protein